MFGIGAALCYLVGFVVSALQPDHVSPWLSPVSMLCLGGFLLVLHLLGFSNWTPRRPQ